MSRPNLLNRLTFRQLQVFQAVHRQQSYSRAAEQLGLTQPAVSAQIRQLEQALEQPLFKYAGKTLHVLPAADALAASVQSIFGQVSSLQMELSELAGTIRGELNLAAVSTAQYVVPHILARFRARYPEVQVRLRVCNRGQALERLAERRDDLVIMGMVPEDANLAFMPILDNEMIPVVWPGHPLLTADAPTLEDFTRYYVLMREPGSGTRTPSRTSSPASASRCATRWSSAPMKPSSRVSWRILALPCCRAWRYSSNSPRDCWPHRRCRAFRCAVRGAPCIPRTAIPRP